MAAALEGGEWSAAGPGLTLPPGKSRYPFYRRLGGILGITETKFNFQSVKVVTRYLIF